MKYILHPVGGSTTKVWVESYLPSDSFFPENNYIYDLDANRWQPFPHMKKLVQVSIDAQGALTFQSWSGQQQKSNGEPLPYDDSRPLLHYLDKFKPSIHPIGVRLRPDPNAMDWREHEKSINFRTTWLRSLNRPREYREFSVYFLPENCSHLPVLMALSPPFLASHSILPKDNFWFSADHKYGMQQTDKTWRLFELASGISLFKKEMSYGSHSAAVISPIIDNKIYCIIYKTQSQLIQGKNAIKMNFIEVDLHHKTEQSLSYSIAQEIQVPMTISGVLVVFNGITKQWNLIVAFDDPSKQLPAVYLYSIYTLQGKTVARQSAAV